MTVKELILELGKFDPEDRVLIDQHGRDDDLEVIGCYEDNVYDDDDNVVEKVAVLYEY